MLAFAHIPTGTAANKGIDIDPSSPDDAANLRAFATTRG
jgi:hypothetical protein